MDEKRNTVDPFQWPAMERCQAFLPIPCYESPLTAIETNDLFWTIAEHLACEAIGTEAAMWSKDASLALYRNVS